MIISRIYKIIGLLIAGIFVLTYNTQYSFAAHGSTPPVLEVVNALYENGIPLDSVLDHGETYFNERTAAEDTPTVESLAMKTWYYGTESNLWEIHFVGNYNNSLYASVDDQYNLDDFSDIYCADHTCRGFIETRWGGGEQWRAYQDALTTGEGFFTASSCGNIHAFAKRQDKCANVTGFQWITNDDGRIYAATGTNDLVLYEQYDATNRLCNQYIADLCINLIGDQGTVPVSGDTFSYSWAPVIIRTVPTEGMNHDSVTNWCEPKPGGCYEGQYEYNGACYFPPQTTCEYVVDIDNDLIIYTATSTERGDSEYTYTWSGATSPYDSNDYQASFDISGFVGTTIATTTVTSAGTSTTSVCSVTINECEYTNNDPVDLSNVDCPGTNQTCVDNGTDPDTCVGIPITVTSCTVSPTEIDEDIDPKTFTWTLEWTGGVPDYTVVWTAVTGNYTQSSISTSSTTVEWLAPTDSENGEIYYAGIEISDNDPTTVDRTYTCTPAKIGECSLDAECTISPNTNCIDSKCQPPISGPTIIDVDPRIVDPGNACGIFVSTTEDTVGCSLIDSLSSNVEDSYTQSLGPLTNYEFSVQPGLYTVECSNGVSSSTATDLAQCIENPNIREN